MKNYLIYSTLLGVFSESLYINIGFDFKFVYIIIFCNYFIIKQIRGTLTVPKYWLYSLIYIFVVGIGTIFLYNNQFSKIVFQVFGISFMSIYFYNFFLCYELDVKDIFLKYCNICFILSLIGIPLFFILVSFDSSYRLHSLLQEPAHFTGIVLPAYYYYMTNFVKYRKKFIVIIVAFLLSMSSIGYIGMLIGFVMIKKKINIFATITLTFVSVLIGFLAYNYIDNVKFRANDTFGIFNEFDVSNVNSSTLALATNSYVTLQVLKSNAFIGHGIGSHPLSSKQYIYNITGIEGYSDNEELMFINSTDADSLTLRILSELGLIGFIGVCYFIIKNYCGYQDNYQISRGIILYFLYKLFREGHYFPAEMYFFVFIYYFLRLKSNAERLVLAS